MNYINFVVRIQDPPVGKHSEKSVSDGRVDNCLCQISPSKQIFNGPYRYTPASAS